jgi:4-hydroxy-tetrahydrodipicolinate synthase
MSAKKAKLKKLPQFWGSMVAIVTPFRNGKVDEKALRNLIEWHITEGSHGIVPCGTTGESATLSHEEHEHVVDVTVDQVKGRIPVIAGTGSNSTKEAIRLTASAKKSGADAALLISPYYNRPSQEGLYHHFKAVAEAVDIPQILYNIPGRTAVNILPQTIARLAKIPNIIGVKEATGDLKQTTEMISLCPKDFLVLSGEDFLNLPLLAIGAKGSISVVANVVPKEMSKIMDAWFAGNPEPAIEFHYKYFVLTGALFLETNPAPVKTALAMMGKMTDEVRLPLYAMSDTNKKKLKHILKNDKLI